MMKDMEELGQLLSLKESGLLRDYLASTTKKLVKYGIGKKRFLGRVNPCGESDEFIFHLNFA